MFCKNDRSGRWVNGTFGKVTELSDDKIVVMIDNEKVTVEKTSWEKTVTTYNHETRKMERSGWYVCAISYPFGMGDDDPQKPRSHIRSYAVAFEALGNLC